MLGKLLHLIIANYKRV